MIPLLVFLYLFLLALATYACYRFTTWNQDGVKNFAALLTVAGAAVSALMTAIVGFYNLYRNQTAAASLENMKADLQRVAASEQVWRDLKLEFEKGKSAGEGAAYRDLAGAADTAYSLLAKLEGSNWKLEDKQAMDEAFQDVGNHLIYLRDETHVELWKKLRQRARYISELAVALKNEKSQQPPLWEKNMPEFSKLVDDFQAIARKEIRRSPAEKDASPKS